MTHATASGVPRARSTAAPDATLAAAVDLARQAAEDAAAPGPVGDHLGAHPDGDRVVTHEFACLDPAYRGWRWAVTVTRASRSKTVTLDEAVLLPGDGALLAPTWVPWSDRLKPGDLGVGDLLVTEVDDDRLEPGYTAGSVVPGLDAGRDDRGTGDAGDTGDTGDTSDTGDAGVTSETIDTGVTGDTGSFGDLDDTDRLALFELGLGRARVLSAVGRDDAVDRWYSGDHGPDAPIARAAPGQCSTCGFFLLMAGSLRLVFGVCANEYSPSDGTVVSADHGCGAHSEVAALPGVIGPAGTIEGAVPYLDEIGFDVIALHPVEHPPGSVDDSAPAEDLGHS